MGLSKELIAVGIICLLIGMMLGAAIGSSMTLNWTVDKALVILNITDEQLDIGKDQLLYAFYKYRNHIS